MKVSLDRCEEVVALIFQRAGLRPERARQQADLFVTTEAKGVWSHGIGLVLKYTQQFLKQTIQTEPRIRVLRRTPNAAVLDGDRGLGVTVVEHGMELAMEMARNTGNGCVTMTNLQHYAAGLYYAQRPTQDGMILMMMANSPSSMAPFGGTRKYFGTNPFTFAAPMGRLPAYCLDMATSVCAGNKLENAMNLGQPVAPGLGLDRNGRTCTDPEEILRHGSLLPFGGAKGSGIAGMINILAGILSGAAYQDDVISLCRDVRKPSNYGCYMQVLDISKFMDLSEYTRRAETWAQAILDNPPGEGFDRVVYPGYPEGMRWQRAKETGLELTPIGLRNLKLAGELVGLDVEELLEEPGMENNAAAQRQMGE